MRFFNGPLLLFFSIVSVSLFISVEGRNTGLNSPDVENQSLTESDESTKIYSETEPKDKTCGIQGSTSYCNFFFSSNDYKKIYLQIATAL